MEKTTTIVLSLLVISIIALNSPIRSEEPAPVEALPSLDQILDRYIEALGGRKALGKLTTRTCKVTAVHDLSYQDPRRQEILMDAYAKVPGKWQIIEHKPTGDRIECFDGEKVWVQEADSAAREHPVRIRKFPYLYDPQNALRIQDNFPELSVKSRVTLRDRAVYAVESSQLDPLYYTLYFDAESGLLVAIGTYWKLLDYREVDGVLLPHKVVGDRKGGSSTYIFDEVKHNQPLEDKLFMIPVKKTSE